MAIVYHIGFKGDGKYPPANAYFVVKEEMINVVDALNDLRAKGWTSKQIAEEFGLTAGYVRALWNPKNMREPKTGSARELWLQRLEDIRELKNQVQPELDDFISQIPKTEITNGTLAQVLDMKGKQATLSSANVDSSFIEVHFNNTYKYPYRNGRFEAGQKLTGA